jgi:invasion protein IalB
MLRSFLIGLVPALISCPVAWAEPSASQGVYGDWRLECAAKDGAERCAISQRILDSKSRNQLLQLAVTGGAHRTIRLLVPLGGWLEPGVEIHFGGSDNAFDIAFSKCLPIGCLADSTLTPELMGALAHIQSASVLVADRNRKVISIPFSLKGFVEAQAALDARPRSPQLGWLDKNWLETDWLLELRKLFGAAK